MKVPWVVILGLGLLAAQANAQESTVLNTDKDKINYGIGVGMARNFKRQGLEVDAELMMKGLKDAISGNKLLLTEEEFQKVMSAFQKDLLQKQAEAAKLAGEKNKKEGEPFLTANKMKEGVVTLPSGLQYKIFTAGNGKTPTINDSVVCHYKGTFIDGTEFDNSYKRNQALTVPVKGVIKGWTEALQLMPVGSKWELVIPASLAYGERGDGPEIGPNATLIFDVELIAIK
jgi:UDP-GlcNAc:undecaprenyl-phosphate/decaprenyl-phosphate GlcNAc-1-phosphate transferase